MGPPRVALTSIGCWRRWRRNWRCRNRCHLHVLAGPFDAACGVGAVVPDQTGALVMENLSLEQQTEGLVAAVAGGEVVFADEALRSRCAGRARRGARLTPAQSP